MEILVSGDNHNISNLVFSLCMSGCLVNLRDIAMSLLPRPTFLAVATITYTFVIPLHSTAFK